MKKPTIRRPITSDSRVSFKNENDFINDVSYDSVGSERSKKLAKSRLNEVTKKKGQREKSVFFRQVPSDIDDLAMCDDRGRYDRTLVYKTALRMFCELPESDRVIYLEKFTRGNLGVNQHGHALTRKNIITKLYNEDIDRLHNANINNKYQFATVLRAALSWFSGLSDEVKFKKIENNIN